MFKDRAQAGMKLAAQLLKYKDDPDAIVLALPRGGVVVGYEIAKFLNLPLDIIVTRKIGLPSNPELALGALAQDGSPVFNAELIENIGLVPENLLRSIERERTEIKRRLKVYRKGRPQLDLTNKTAILIDDGIATGATMRAAVASAQMLGAKKIVLAVPVMPDGAVETFKSMVDEFICLHEAEVFWGVGAFYQRFEQVEDPTVVDLLLQAYT